MHRTTTTATLLVTVAVSALAGCVTIQRPPAPGPVRAPAQPSAPRSDGRAAPQIVQAPAQEALELIGPPRRPEHKPPAPQRPTQSAPAPAAPPAQPPTPRSHPRPAHPRPERPAKQRPRVELPDVTESVRENADVCALGKKYGGWRGDSPEARICEQTYGR
ncbi:hypothetical protein OHT76_07035 [Streptomyces sp. NBC_00287]|uniref:hypothetical protein n=1 Tax=Streptomyces sp. NBC_00287 TaxID=2975702 RepID=UPI002E2DD74D|nr:hypothetical protein [Streptomyces sp. NBC_00287]